MNRNVTKEYPQWIQKHRTPGTTVKMIGGKYYLYRRKTSKRVEGKTNPQPVYEFLGTITEEGLIPPKKRRVNISGAKVREFGFSFTLGKICPESWKEIQGARWQDKLLAVIMSRSKNSYVQDVYGHIKPASELRMQMGAVTASLGRKIKEAYGLELNDLQMLDTIYIISMDGKHAISRVNGEQQAILDRLGITMEVPEGYC